MVVPQSLKLNKFRVEHILPNREIFSRFGRFTPGSQAYSGDEDLSSRLFQTKTDALARTDRELSHQVEVIKESQKRQEEEKK